MPEKLMIKYVTFSIVVENIVLFEIWCYKNTNTAVNDKYTMVSGMRRCPPYNATEMFCPMNTLTMDRVVYSESIVNIGKMPAHSIRKYRALL